MKEKETPAPENTERVQHKVVADPLVHPVTPSSYLLSSSVISVAKGPGFPRRHRFSLSVFSAITILIVIIGILFYFYPLEEMIGEKEGIKVEVTQTAVRAPIQIPITVPAVIKDKVIGNRDSKRYHLPGMKYYHEVEDYHRVEFDSETAAIQAGYRKAPR